MRRTHNAARSEVSKIFVETAPCDGCPSKKRCGFFHIACPDFAEYVDEGRILHLDRKATPEVYDTVYDGADEDG